jgi:hypothetical protein
MFEFLESISTHVYGRADAYYNLSRLKPQLEDRCLEEFELAKTTQPGIRKSNTSQLASLMIVT